MYLSQYKVAISPQGEYLDGEPLPNPDLDGVPLGKEEDLDGVPSELGGGGGGGGGGGVGS